MRWTGRAILWLVVALLVLAIVGAIYQAIATARAERAHPPPGELVDVGGHRLHIHFVGQGSPTVVLDAALGSISASWVWVQREVSGTTRVCAYDRAGMGWSESGLEPRDARQVTGELHALLKGADIGKGPYVLVGHSYGGLYSQTYAARYPDEVAGVALVESSHPEQFSRLPEARDSYDETKRLYAVASLLARIGVVRLFGLSPAPPELPQHQRAQIAALNPSTRQVSTTAQEFHATPQTTAKARSLRSLGDKPLAVVSAGTQSSGWLELQDDLATLSPNSMHRVVEGATHTSLVYERSDAQSTSAAIVEVVQAVRNDRPLTR
ncbi:MAG TPA: alpha/beta fold hydrolase [Rubrobacter sp.]|jgi:pimeloyl-ACP methyl ester carboxylesterase|nr:alpha/beta fold hydrolase [Rubrobacter sp.]